MSAAVMDVELAKSAAIAYVDQQAEAFRETNRAIWSFAEPSLQEYRSAELLASLRPPSTSGFAGSSRIGSGATPCRGGRAAIEHQEIPG